MRSGARACEAPRAARGGRARRRARARAARKGPREREEEGGRASLGGERGGRRRARFLLARAAARTGARTAGAEPDDGDAPRLRTRSSTVASMPPGRARRGRGEGTSSSRRALGTAASRARDRAGSGGRASPLARRSPRAAAACARGAPGLVSRRHVPWCVASTPSDERGCGRRTLEKSHRRGTHAAPRRAERAVVAARAAAARAPRHAVREVDADEEVAAHAGGDRPRPAPAAPAAAPAAAARRVGLVLDRPCSSSSITSHERPVTCSQL